MPNKERVALSSVAASAFMAVTKFAVGLLTGSLGILAEAAHSLIDLGATVLTYAAVRVSGRPPDKEHPYGHAKIESISALAETALLFLTSGWIVYEAAQRLSAEGVIVETTWWAAGVMVLSIAIDFFRARALTKVARETKSQALEADALHFSSDMLSGAVVLSGLGLVKLGWTKGDTLAAMGVAGFVCLAGWRLGRRTIDMLIDTAPRGVSDRIRRIAETTPAVAGVERVRVRPSGPYLFIDLEVAVSRTHPLERVSEIERMLVERIVADFPEAETVIHVRPIALDDERVADRVRGEATKRGLSIYRIAVQHVSGRASVSLSLEVDGRQTLGEAHATATSLEAAIRDELGPGTEVDTHIEPAFPEESDATDVSPEELAAIVASAREAARKRPAIQEIHKVRARRSPCGLTVTLHCRFAPDATLEAVHAEVDDFEQDLLRRLGNARRVLVHAEPMRA